MINSHPKAALLITLMNGQLLLMLPVCNSQDANNENTFENPLETINVNNNTKYVSGFEDSLKGLFSLVFDENKSFKDVGIGEEFFNIFDKDKISKIYHETKSVNESEINKLKSESNTYDSNSATKYNRDLFLASKPNERLQINVNYSQTSDKKNKCQSQTDDFIKINIGIRSDENILSNIVNLNETKSGLHNTIGINHAYTNETTSTKSEQNAEEFLKNYTKNHCNESIAINFTEGNSLKNSAFLTRDDISASDNFGSQKGITFFQNLGNIIYSTINKIKNQFANKESSVVKTDSINKMNDLENINEEELKDALLENSNKNNIRKEGERKKRDVDENIEMTTGFYEAFLTVNREEIEKIRLRKEAERNATLEEERKRLTTTTRATKKTTTALFSGNATELSKLMIKEIQKEIRFYKLTYTTPPFKIHRHDIWSGWPWFTMRVDNRPPLSEYLINKTGLHYYNLYKQLTRKYYSRNYTRTTKEVIFENMKLHTVVFNPRRGRPTLTFFMVKPNKTNIYRKRKQKSTILHNVYNESTRNPHRRYRTRKTEKFLFGNMKLHTVVFNPRRGRPTYNFFAVNPNKTEEVEKENNNTTLTSD